MCLLLDGQALVAQRKFSRCIQAVQVVTGDGSEHTAEKKADQFQGKEQETSHAPSILKQNLGEIGQSVSQVVKIAPHRFNDDLLETH